MSNAFGQCFGNQSQFHLNYCFFLKEKKKKKPGKCSASLFDASELFSPMLCVDAMYNLCAGRILECPFIIVQTDYHYRFLRPAEKASSFVGPELKHLP